MANDVSKKGDPSFEENTSHLSVDSDENHFPMELIPNDLADSENIGRDTTVKGEGVKVNENKVLTESENTIFHRTRPGSQKKEVAQVGPKQDGANKDSEETDKKSCLGCRRCCLNCWKPCLVKYHPLTDQPSRCEKFKHALMCPPHGKLAQWATLILSVLIFWGVLWSITGASALPGGSLFSILVLLVSAVIAGQLVALIKLPPLLGIYLLESLRYNMSYFSLNFMVI